FAQAKHVGQFFALPLHVCENFDLADQYLRIEWLEQEVYGPCIVTTKLPSLFSRSRGYKDDRYLGGPTGTSHELGQFEAVHLRHLHVHECYGDLLLEQEFQRLGSRAC